MNNLRDIFLFDSQPYFTEDELDTFNNRENGNARKRQFDNCSTQNSDNIEPSSNAIDLDGDDYIKIKSKKISNEQQEGNARKRQFDNCSTQNSDNIEPSSNAVDLDGDDHIKTKSKKNSNEQQEGIRECDTDYKSDGESSEKSDNANGQSCIECKFDKELDKRNYYFGNLLIGELQFLQPCMRSEAYISILKYVDSLKQKHRKSQ